MLTDKPTYIESQYYIGPERRHAYNPRREMTHCRRHRNRTESLISDCRTNMSRRREDSEGFVEISTLYCDDEGQTNIKKT